MKTRDVYVVDITFTFIHMNSFSNNGLRELIALRDE